MRFGPVTRFEVKPLPAAPFRALQENELERLKDRLLKARLAAAPPRLNVPLQRAANDAVALAWVTPYPTLVFPELFAEKAEETVRRAELQERVRERSALFFAA